MEKKICTDCKIEKSIDQFKSKVGRDLKTCLHCRTIKNKKCIHNKYKYNCVYCHPSLFCEHKKNKYCCKECDGSKVCEHKKIKNSCKECGIGYCEHNQQKHRCIKCKGSSICEHNVIKYCCKKCNGSAICQHNSQKGRCKLCKNAKLITIQKMIYHSKENDIKYNRYDANNFIDKCFIEMLMDESLLCHYCEIQMQLIEYNDTLCTIERLDNSIGHIKSNCVLACKKCNLSRGGRIGNK